MKVDLVLNMEYQIRKQLNILIQLAKSDKVFTDSEKKAILKIGRDRGCKESEVMELMEHPNMKDSLAPMTLSQKMDFILDTISVVIADEKINIEEENFAKQIAKKLGFRDHVINFLIEYQSMDRKALKDLMVPYLIQDFF